MGPKHFENKARREWWSLHVDAWQRSGLSQRSYCAIHRLTETTFVRWRRVLTDAQATQTQAELLRERRRERRRKRRIRLSTDMRSKAVQAYWAMHVEALTWCGMSAQAYAKAHHLSVHSLKRWRILLEAGEVQIDWRAHVHPSALPQISTSASSAAKEAGALLSDITKGITKVSPADAGLTNATDEAPGDEQRRRRKFSVEEKLAIVLESEQPEATISGVARARGIAIGVLFRWRAELGFTRDKPVRLASVVLRNGRSEAALLQGLMQQPEGTTVVELSDGRHVFAPIGSDPDAVRQHVAERETMR